MNHVPADVLFQCRSSLIEMKSRLLADLLAHKLDLTESRDFRGDEADQTTNVLTEHQIFLQGRRIRGLLLEIEQSLARMEKGAYGVCEVTGEPIEIARLLAIPWTRYSLEGAEHKESSQSRNT